MYYGSGSDLCCCIGTGRQVAALCCLKWCHGWHLVSVTSNQKYDCINRCPLTWRTILPNFIPIRIVTLVFSWNEEVSHPNKNNKNQMSSDMRSVADLKITQKNNENENHENQLWQAEFQLRSIHFLLPLTALVAQRYSSEDKSIVCKYKWLDKSSHGYQTWTLSLAADFGTELGRQ